MNLEARYRLRTRKKAGSDRAHVDTVGSPSPDLPSGQSEKSGHRTREPRAGPVLTGKGRAPGLAPRLAYMCWLPAGGLAHPRGVWRMDFLGPISKTWTSKASRGSRPRPRPRASPQRA